MRSFYGNPIAVVPGTAALTSLDLSKITGALEGRNPRIVSAKIRGTLALTADAVGGARWDCIAALLGQASARDTVDALIDGTTGLDLAHLQHMDFPTQPFTRDLAPGAVATVQVEWNLPFGRLNPRTAPASSMIPAAQFIGGDISANILAASGIVGANAVTCASATLQAFIRTVDMFGDRDEPWRRMVTKCYAVDSMSDSYDIVGNLQWAGMRTGIIGATGELGAVPTPWNAGADYTISSEDIAYSEQISNDLNQQYFDNVKPYFTPPSVAPRDEWDGVVRGVVQNLFAPEWRSDYMPPVCKLQYRASTLALPTTGPVFMARYFENSAAMASGSPSGLASAAMTPGGGGPRAEMGGYGRRGRGGCNGNCPRRNRGRCGGC